MCSEWSYLDLYAELLWVSKMHINQVNPVLKGLPGPGLDQSGSLLDMRDKDGSHVFSQSPVLAGGL